MKNIVSEISFSSQYPRVCVRARGGGIFISPFRAGTRRAVFLSREKSREKRERARARKVGSTSEVPTRSVQRVARGEHGAAKLKGDEEYHGEKWRPGGGERGGGRTTISRGEREPRRSSSFSIPQRRRQRVVKKLFSPFLIFLSFFLVVPFLSSSPSTARKTGQLRCAVRSHSGKTRATISVNPTRAACLTVEENGGLERDELKNGINTEKWERVVKK